MILVVVLVHPVAPDQVQILKPVHPPPQLLEAVIRAEVGRVRLRYAHHMRVQHLGRPQDPDLLQLANSKSLQLRIRHGPQRIALVAEILQPQPHLVRIRHHKRAPVVEDLQPPKLHIRLLDIDPRVPDQPTVPILHIQPVGQHAHSYKIPVLQPFTHLTHVGGYRRAATLQSPRQLLHGHRRQKHLALEAPLLPLRIGSLHGHHAPSRAILARAQFHTVDRPSHVDLATACGHLLRNMLPQLPRPELRIQKSLDQRRIRLLLRQIAGPFTRTHCLRPPRKSLAQKVPQRGRKAQALDALRSPLSRDLLTRHPPHLLRVALKEGQVQLPPKAINQEVLKALLRPDWPHARPQVAEADPQHAQRTQVRNRRAGELDRVFKKLAQVINPALPRTHQHHMVRILRLRRVHHDDLCRCFFQRITSVRPHALRIGLHRRQRPHAAQRWMLRRHCGHLHNPPLALIGDLHRNAFVTPALLGCWGHQLHPPLHHAIALGKKPMTPDVHPVAFVPDRPRDPPDLPRRLQHNRLHPRAPQQLQSRRQSRRPRSNNDGFTTHAIVCCAFSA